MKNFNRKENSTYLGIPNGSLSKKTIELLIKAGVLSQDPKRVYEIKSEIDGLIIRVLDRKEMANQIDAGVVDAGITGKDYNAEMGFDGINVPIADFVYSKTSNKPSRLVLASYPDNFESVEDCKGARIATELPNLTQKCLKEKYDFSPEDLGNIVSSKGKTEAKVSFDMADAYTDITETGDTMRKNGFSEIATLFYSNPQLLLNKEAFDKNPEARSIIENVALATLAVLKAEKDPMSYVTMNVSSSLLENVLKFLPSNTSPTISQTNDERWLSVSTLMPTRQVDTLAPKLLQYGVRGIVPMPAGAVYNENMLKRLYPKTP